MNVFDQGEGNIVGFGILIICLFWGKDKYISPPPHTHWSIMCPNMVLVSVAWDSLKLLGNLEI